MIKVNAGFALVVFHVEVVLSVNVIFGAAVSIAKVQFGLKVQFRLAPAVAFLQPILHTMRPISCVKV